MNTKMKMTVLAGALALAVAGQANAAIIDSNNANGSDLILSVWNAAGVSFMADLGSSMAGYVDTTVFPGVAATTLPAFSVNSTVNTALVSFLSTNAAAASSFQWNVTAADTANGIVLTTVAAADQSKVATTTDLALQAGINSAQLYYAGANIVAGAANAFVSGTSTTALAYGGQGNFGAKWSNNVAFNTTGAIGSSLGFDFLTAAGNPSGLVNSSVYQGLTFSLTSTGLTAGAVAAVPEPGEWLLMLSGLAILGFIATRRKGQASSMSFA